VTPPDAPQKWIEQQWFKKYLSTDDDPNNVDWVGASGAPVLVLSRSNEAKTDKKMPATL
jgi:hypothetical protein